MGSELLMTSAISCPLWTSVYEWMILTVSIPAILLVPTFWCHTIFPTFSSKFLLYSTFLFWLATCGFKIPLITVKVCALLVRL